MNIKGETVEVRVGEHLARVNVDRKESGLVDLAIWGEVSMWRDNAADLELEDMAQGEAVEMLSKLIEILQAQRDALA